MPYYKTRTDKRSNGDLASLKGLKLKCNILSVVNTIILYVELLTRMIDLIRKLQVTFEHSVSCDNKTILGVKELRE